MRLDDARESDNVEDRRGMGGASFPGGTGGLGIGGVIVLLVVSYFLGIDPSSLLNQAGGGGGSNAPLSSEPAGAPASDAATQFVRRVLADTEDTWAAIFQQAGQ